MIRVLPFLLLAMLFAKLVTAFWGLWAMDLSAIYYAAWFYADGQLDLVYAAAPTFFGADASPAWTALAAEQGHPGDAVLPYVYPPIWAAIFGKVVQSLDPQTFFNAALIVQAALYCAAILLALDLAHLPRSELVWQVAIQVFLAVMAIPIVFAFSLGQPQITIVLLILLAFALYVRGFDLGAGGLLGLAAAIKLTPIVLVLIFVADRRWRAGGATILMAGGIALLSIAVAGWPLHEAYLDRLAAISGLTLINNSMPSLTTVLVYVAGPEPVLQGTAANGSLAVVATPGWISLLMKTLLALAVGVSYLVFRWAPRDTASQLVFLSIILVLAAPLSWSHYLILPLLLVSPLLARRSRAMSFIFVIATLMLLYWQPLPFISFEITEIDRVFREIIWLALALFLTCVAWRRGSDLL